MFNRPEAVVEAVEEGAAQAPPLKLKPDRKYPVRSSTVLVTCGVDSVIVSPFFSIVVTIRCNCEVKHCAGHLLLVGEAQLDRSQGDVEALDKSLLADSQEHRPVRVAEELLGDEASPDLVIYPVLHLSREGELEHNTSLTGVSHLVKCDDGAVNGCQEDVV